MPEFIKIVFVNKFLVGVAYFGAYGCIGHNKRFGFIHPYHISLMKFPCLLTSYRYCGKKLLYV